MVKDIKSQLFEEEQNYLIENERGSILYLMILSQRYCGIFYSSKNLLLTAHAFIVWPSYHSTVEKDLTQNRQ